MMFSLPDFGAAMRESEIREAVDGVVECPDCCGAGGDCETCEGTGEVSRNAERFAPDAGASEPEDEVPDNA